MDCDTCREALSARLDGEAEPVVPDGHLHSCAGCQEWYAAASAVNWLIPTEPSPMPDFVDEVLDQVEPSGGASPRWRPRRSR